MLLPIRVNGQKETIEYTDMLSRENTLYRPSDQSLEITGPRIQTAASNHRPQVQGASYGYCSCVKFIEAKFPQIEGIGYARNWPVNAKNGDIGEVIVLNESFYGHVAEIIGFNESGWVVDEANYTRCQHSTGRIIPYNSPDILGFWIP